MFYKFYTHKNERKFHIPKPCNAFFYFLFDMCFEIDSFKLKKIDDKIILQCQSIIIIYLIKLFLYF